MILLMFLVILCLFLFNNSFCYPYTIGSSGYVFDDAPPKNSQSYYIKNTSKKFEAFKINIMERQHNIDGKESRVDTTDFQINPSNVLVEPGKTQYFSIKYIGEKIASERAYRLLFERIEIKSLEEAKKEAPKKLSLNIPVIMNKVKSIYVVPKGADLFSSCTYHSHQIKKIDGKKSLIVTIVNNGNQHQILQGITVNVFDEMKNKIFTEIIEQLQTPNLLPGQKLNLIFEYPVNLDDTNVAVEVIHPNT